MNRQMRFLLLMFLLLSQAGSLAAEVRVGSVDITLEPLLSSQWVCYVKDGDLYLWSTGKDPLRMREGKGKGVTIMSPSLRAAGPSIFMAWIERSPGGNKVLFTASRDNGRTFGDIAELASGIKATNVRIFADSKENLYIIDASGKEPELFLNLSSDKGKTFRRVPLQLEELSSLYHPVVVVTDDVLHLFYFAMKGNKGQVRATTVDPVSLEQKGSVVLKEVEGVSFMEGWSVKGKPVVLYKTSHEGVFSLEGFVKEDALWKAFRVKEAEGLDVARMDHHEWEDGRVLVVFSGEDRWKFKQRIYAAVSEDAGMNWDVKRIDKSEFDNTRAWLPRMAVDGRKVAVVWEDSRDIRSGVRMKLFS